MRAGRVGNYNIVSCIGEGGMGAVYRVEHVMLGRPAAIKVLLPELSRNEEMVSRFFNEARATARLQHPGIIDVYDFGYCEDDNAAFIVMELLHGQSLRQRLAEVGRLPWDQAIAFARQIALALAAAHRNHIVHRDLKPDNVFLVNSVDHASAERVKVLDFGIAKLVDSGNRVKTRAGSVMGTPSYMSPQQCRGAGEVDHRADIYSLGCMLFEMVCGRPPFLGEGMGDLLLAHLNQQPPTPSQLEPSVPPVLDTIILRMLAKSEADRQQTMDEVVAELDYLSAARPSQSMPSAVPSPLLMNTVLPSVPPQGPHVATAPHGSHAHAPPANTTLAGSTGQVTKAPAGRSKLPFVIAGVAGAVAVALALVIVLGGDDDKPEQRVAASAAPAAAPSAAAEPAPPPRRKPKLSVVQLTDEQLAQEAKDAKAKKPEAAAASAAPRAAPGKPAGPSMEDNRRMLAALLQVSGPVGALVMRHVGDEFLVKNLGPTAELRIESKPSGAAVTYDGATIGKTPLSISVDRGAYDIVVDLALAGYADRTVAISAMVEHTEQIAMAQLVKLRIVSKPPGAAVETFGDALGVTPLEVSIGQSTEAQPFTLKLKGYLDKDVDIAPTKTSTVTVELEPEPQPVVHEIDSVPSGAEVVLDDVVLGKTPYRVEFLEEKGKFRSYVLRVPNDTRYRDTPMRAPADKPLKRVVKIRDLCASRASQADSSTPTLVNPYDPCRNK